MDSSAENLAVAAPEALARSIGQVTNTAEALPSPAPPAAEPAPASASQANGNRRGGPVVEKHYRSLLKAVSWRATGTLDTILISFLITGKIKLAVSIGFVEVFTKIALFYAHERLWNKIPLGRSKTPEDYAI